MKPRCAICADSGKNVPATHLVPLFCPLGKDESFWSCSDCNPRPSMAQFFYENGAVDAYTELVRGEAVAT